MKPLIRIVCCLTVCSAVASLPAFGQATIYRTVDELWRGYDPRSLPLDPEIVSEEQFPEGTVRKIYYTAEVSNGFRVRVVAFYGFPKEAKNIPAVFHIHGGGQNASKDYIRYWMKRGYVSLSINWGGVPQSSDPKDTTDWGPLQVYQLDRTNLYRTKPDTRSNGWYHWTIACRRAITFLEKQPQVDPSAIGVFGVSMGGRLTWLVAGVDDRVKVAASVYGSVSLQQPLPGRPGSEQVHFDTPDEAAIWAGSLDAIAYAPRIRCPFLFLSASDDFYGDMDNVDVAIGRIPHAQKWQAFSPHFNHHVAAQEAEALPRWMDWHLRHADPFPVSPQLRIDLKSRDHVPQAILPQQRSKVAKVQIYYSTDPYPQSRFWHTAKVSETKHGWTAALPILDGPNPLRAFANVTYQSGLTLSSRLVTTDRELLSRRGIQHISGGNLVIDDFSQGPSDWFVPQAGPNLLLSRVEPFRTVADEKGKMAVTFGPGAGWSIATRKVGDPQWTGPAGASLRLSAKSEQHNSFYVVITENEFRRDKKTKVFIAPVELPGDNQWQTFTLTVTAFRAPEGEDRLTSWNDVNLLWFVPQYTIRDVSKFPFTNRKLGEVWQGTPPAFGKIEWIPSSY